MDNPATNLVRTCKGESIEQLKLLAHHKTINLSNTDFEEANLAYLKDFKILERVFLFKSSVNKTGTDYINEVKTTVEYGNFALP